MVRFSDMLGGSGEPGDERAIDSPYAALASDDLDAVAADEPDAAEGEAEGADGSGGIPDSPPPGVETPEDVLQQLTKYATSARVADPVPPEAEAGPADEPTGEADPAPTGDDFLPHPKSEVHRTSWGRKRRP